MYLFFSPTESLSAISGPAQILSLRSCPPASRGNISRVKRYRTETSSSKERDDNQEQQLRKHPSKWPHVLPEHFWNQENLPSVCYDYFITSWIPNFGTGEASLISVCNTKISKPSPSLTSVDCISFLSVTKSPNWPAPLVPDKEV